MLGLMMLGLLMLGWLMHGLLMDGGFLQLCLLTPGMLALRLLMLGVLNLGLLVLCLLMLGLPFASLSHGPEISRSRISAVLRFRHLGVFASSLQRSDFLAPLMNLLKFEYTFYFL